MFKKIFKGLGVLLTLILLTLLGLYLIPPKQQQIDYDYITELRDPDLDSKVGWYKTDDGDYYQLSWDAKRGLQLNRFDSLRSKLKSLRLTKIDTYTFDTDGETDSAEAVFEEIDSTFTLKLNTGKTNFIATKVDSTFYSQEEVNYFNGDIKLSALLLKPYEIQKSTAIVFIHGSGVSDRDNFWYMHQADFLAKQGFTVLLPDKRGCGKSMGEWHIASFRDFAEDALAGVDYLKSNYPKYSGRIGLLGLSQGGWISQQANVMSDQLDFVIDVVSSGTTPNEQVEFEVMRDIEDAGAPGFIASPLSKIFAKRARGKRKIWWDKNGEFNPIDLIGETKIPVLKIFGGEDKNLPVERSLQLIRELQENMPDLPLTVKVFEGSGHGLMNQETQWVREDYLQYMADWIEMN